jgi:hypothetical protein
LVLVLVLVLVLALLAIVVRKHGANVRGTHSGSLLQQLLLPGSAARRMHSQACPCRCCCAIAAVVASSAGRLLPCSRADPPLPPALPPALQDVLWRMSNSVLGPFKADFMDTTAEQPDLCAASPAWAA